MRNGISLMWRLKIKQFRYSTDLFRGCNDQMRIGFSLLEFGSETMQKTREYWINKKQLRQDPFVRRHHCLKTVVEKKCASNGKMHKTRQTAADDNFIHPSHSLTCTTGRTESKRSRSAAVALPTNDIRFTWTLSTNSGTDATVRTSWIATTIWKRKRKQSIYRKTGTKLMTRMHATDEAFQ